MSRSNHLSSLPRVGLAAAGFAGGATASAWLVIPAQVTARPEATTAETITTAGTAPADCRLCPENCEQSLVLVAILFAVVALVGVLAWTAAFWKLLGLLKTQCQPPPPSRPTGHAPEAGSPDTPSLSLPAPGQPGSTKAPTATPDGAALADGSLNAAAANQEAAPGPVGNPASAPPDQRNHCHFLPDFLFHADFQNYYAAIFTAEADASRDAELLAGNLAVLNAAVKASERRHYHDSMLETALRGIGTCLANLSRRPNPDLPVGDLLTWEKQIQNFLSTTTEYGLRTPMSGEKVDNDWMSAPPRAITVSGVDCWAIYKRNDVVCKALVH